MHFCILVITKEFPSDEVLKNQLKPFYEDDYYQELEAEANVDRPVFQWDYFKLGGRYGGRLKIDISGENSVKYDLQYYARQKRSGRLFRAAILEAYDFDDVSFGKPNEINALCYMGLWDDVIFADAAPIQDCKAIPDGFGIVLPDGAAYARRVWSGDSWDDDPEFDNRRAAALEAHKDCWVSVVDIHD